MNEKIKKRRPVSRVLFLPKEASIIYLRSLSPMTSSNLPLPTFLRNQSGPLCDFPEEMIGIYLVLQHMRCTAAPVTRSTGELLPHLFTLTTPKRDGYFLLHYYKLSPVFQLGSMLPCVARTFLTICAR